MYTNLKGGDSSHQLLTSSGLNELEESWMITWPRRDELKSYPERASFLTPILVPLLHAAGGQC